MTEVIYYENIIAYEIEFIFYKLALKVKIPYYMSGHFSYVGKNTPGNFRSNLHLHFETSDIMHFEPA